MENKPVTIKSIDQYVSEILSANLQIKRNGLDKNEILLFRGQQDTNYELLPSIGRNRRSKFDITIFNEERNLIDACKYRMPDVFRNDLSPIELLALLQHHGIPTRLLDVTENSLVALYFACNGADEKDGEVFVFKHNEINTTNYPLIEAIAESYKFAKDSICIIDHFYQHVREQPYFLEQRSTLDTITQMPTEDLYFSFGVRNLGEYIAKMCEKPLFVYAPIRSIRQQMQQGRYILFPNSIMDFEVKGSIIKAFETKIDPISKKDKCIIKTLLIPYQNKKQILNELRLFGVSEESLFCDNTDIVCKNITATFQNKVGCN